MKKIAALILALSFTIALYGCGKSEAAKAADDLIAAIGEVSLNSEVAITAAEKAVSELDDKDRDSLDNTATLKKARMDYEKLVDMDKVSKVEAVIDLIGVVTLESDASIEAAQAAYDKLEDRLKDQVNNFDRIAEAQNELSALIDAETVSKVEDVIEAIGEVTLESGASIEAAQAAYDELEDRLKDQVNNYDLIGEAEERLKRLEAENRAARVEEARKLIEQIGEVSMESGEAIIAARKAYRTLTPEEAALVSNAEVLEEAVNVYRTTMLEHVEDLLKAFKLDEDVFQGVEFYYPFGWQLDNRGYWVADASTFIRPYIIRRSNSNSFGINVVYNYTGDSWVFWTKLTILADDQRFTKEVSYNKVVRDNSGRRVWEYYTDTAPDMEMLRVLAEAASVQMRFEGSEYWEDYSLSAVDKKAIQQTLDVYDALLAISKVLQ